MYKQHPPFSIEVEPTLGCPLRCQFCGIHGITLPSKSFIHMGTDTAQALARQIGDSDWHSSIHFSGRGEPTKNPHILEIIATFRTYLLNNYLFLSTNGSGFLANTAAAIRERVREYFTAGLNTINLSEYEQVPWANIIRKAHRQVASLDYSVYEYPTEPAGNPQKPVLNHQRLSITAPINLSRHGTRSRGELTNRCGAAGPLVYTMLKRRCARPFRQMSVRWDGAVVICCHDWRGEFKLGLVTTPKNSLTQIWHSPALSAARRKLLYWQRDFPPCLGCNARSHRLGLLPDVKGIETLPEPDEECERILRQVVEGPSYIAPKLRPWDSAEGTRNSKPGLI